MGENRHEKAVPRMWECLFSISQQMGIEQSQCAQHQWYEVVVNLDHQFDLDCEGPGRLVKHTYGCVRVFS
jgi:hypothetical protein